MASFTMLCCALDSKRSRPYSPPLSRVADNALPVAGDTVTLRSGNMATVLAVGSGDFDEPVFYLDTRVQVYKYAITGVMSERMVA